MPCYRVFNRLVSSNLQFPGMESLPEEAAEFEFRAVWFMWHPPFPIAWLRQPESGEEPCLGKCGAEFLVRFPNLADFLVSENRRVISCHAEPNVSSETIRHLFLDQVLPCLIGNRDAVVLHASAVAISSGAVVFIGESGWGKSTLGASLSANGFALLTDDGVMVQWRESQLLCVPSYPGLRLWPESVVGVLGAQAQGIPMVPDSVKQRFGRENTSLVFANEALPVKKIYLLANPAENVQSVSIVSMNLREAYLELLKHIYRLDFSDWKRIGEECDLAAKIVEATRPGRLSFPREFDFLPFVRRTLLADLASGATT
jgi:hypothetical protein